MKHHALLCLDLRHSWQAQAQLYTMTRKVQLASCFKANRFKNYQKLKMKQEREKT